MVACGLRLHRIYEIGLMDFCAPASSIVHKAAPNAPHHSQGHSRSPRWSSHGQNTNAIYFSQADSNQHGRVFNQAFSILPALHSLSRIQPCRDQYQGKCFSGLRTHGIWMLLVCKIAMYSRRRSPFAPMSMPTSAAQPTGSPGLLPFAQRMT